MTFWTNWYSSKLKWCTIRYKILRQYRYNLNAFWPDYINDTLATRHLIFKKTNVNHYLLESFSVERFVYFRITIKNRPTNMMLKWHLFNVNNFTTRWRQGDSSTSQQCQVYFASIKIYIQKYLYEHLEIDSIIAVFYLKSYDRLR